MRIEDELRAKLPVLSARAANGSRQAAIKLFCYSCVGGDRTEARRCVVTACFIYPYSPAAKAAGKAAAVDDDPEDEEGTAPDAPDEPDPAEETPPAVEAEPLVLTEPPVVAAPDEPPAPPDTNVPIEQLALL